MSQEKVEIRTRNTKTAPTMQSRSTIIQRHSAGGNMPIAGTRSSTLRMSYGGGGFGGGAPSFAQGTVSGMSQKNVANVLDTRAKEKNEMNVLNERFASYIEKVRFVEAQNKALLAEIERLKKQKNFDVSEIKELYEQEIADSRKIIDDLSDEKAKFDSTLVSLQDQLEDEKRDRITAEKTVDDLRNKIDRQNDQIGGYEGELANLRLRIDTLEDENARLKKDKKTLQDDIARIRADLDEETCKRIQAEMKLQTAEEDFKFNQNIYEAEIAELRAMLDKDKSIEMKDIWKGEIQKAISELQQQYANELDRMQGDMQKNFEMQLTEMKAGVNRDNMEALSAREESKKVKGKLSELQPLINQLQAENAMLKSRLEALQIQYDDECRDHEEDRLKLEAQIQKLSSELESILRELQILQDAKLSLELEISCYRKLLESEEQSLKRVVEESSGSRSSGAQLLSDMIVTKGGSESSQKSSMSTSSRKVNLVKNSRGDLRFERCDPSGTKVTLKNNGNKQLSMRGWRLIKNVNGIDKCKFNFPEDYFISAQREVTICGKVMADELEYGELLAEFNTWGTHGKFILYDEKNVEKASMDVQVL